MTDTTAPSPTETSLPATTQVLVVGAGPYGLAVAQELWRRGIATQVVGQPFALWLDHTLDSMLLRSDHRASEIWSAEGRYSFTEFLDRRGLGQDGERIGVGVFREYLHEVLDALPFPLHRGRVTHLARPVEGDREHLPVFEATLDDGSRIDARAVVLATGSGGHLHLPGCVAALAGEVEDGRVLHSWETRSFGDLTGEEILVIGGGQSAAEAVEHLRGVNRITWALRREPLFFSEPLRLPTPLFKAVLAVSPAFYYLPQLVRRLIARATFRTTITPNLRQAFDDPEVRVTYGDAEDLGLEATADGRVRSGRLDRTFDRVISATGFRYSLAGLDFLAPELAARLGVASGLPPLDLDFETPVPGLHLAGGIAETAFGPAQRFILGSRQAARRLGRALGKRFAEQPESLAQGIGSTAAVRGAKGKGDRQVA